MISHGTSGHLGVRALPICSRRGTTLRVPGPPGPPSPPALRVLCQGPTQPAVVLRRNCPPRLPSQERRVVGRHVAHSAHQEIELDGHGFLAPQGPVVVEHGYPLLTRDVVWTVPGDRLDELHDGVSRVSIVPGGQWVVARVYVDGHRYPLSPFVCRVARISNKGTVRQSDLPCPVAQLPGGFFGLVGHSRRQS
jgi:hypothetical protein